MVGLYEFLKNFDVIENTTQIKCKLYQDAIAYMQHELDEERKQSGQKDKKSIEQEEAPKSAEQDLNDGVIVQPASKQNKKKKSKGEKNASDKKQPEQVVIQE